jgi:LysR family transcriptional regulator, carnitine catabolism transcriptional activator
MNLSQRQLQMFTVLANIGHFSKASEVLHISQPALSRAIQELESQFDVPLFVRSTRQLTLSDAGKRLLPKAQSLLNDLEQISKDMRNQFKVVGGVVSVAVGSAFGSTLLPHILMRFRLDYPDVQVRIIDDMSQGTTARVVSGEVDVGIGTPVGDSSTLACVGIAHAPIGLLASPHFFNLHQALAEEMLGELPLLLEPDSTSIMAHLSMRGHDVVGYMQGGIEVSSLAIELALVRAGVGVAVLSALGASHPSAQGLDFVPIKPGVEREIFILTRRQRKLPAAAAAFVSTMHSCLATLRSNSQQANGLHPLVRIS